MVLKEIVCLFYFLEWWNDTESLVSKFWEEFLLVQVAVFVKVSFFDELHNIVIADVNVEVLIEDILDLVDTH